MRQWMSVDTGHDPTDWVAIKVLTSVWEVPGFNRNHETDNPKIRLFLVFLDLFLQQRKQYSD